MKPVDDDTEALISAMVKIIDRRKIEIDKLRQENEALKYNFNKLVDQLERIKKAIK